ncbi:ribonuclease YeeF family protein [Halobacillus hunanensis]|uniref:ribonuclease YeeF family protein n=1 Tax=Halobacillus hunanensis TaxID=578214 RepID=UPI00111688A4|nr:T7SS effector LXG polymorphic toxin [Halobacillus hunanensis]
MKVLDVPDLQKGGEETIRTLENLRNSVQQVKVSIKAIIDLEDSLRGEGGEAIRAFYQEAHLPFLSYLEQFLSQYEEAIRKMMASLNELEPDADGLIREDFLEQEVEAGLHKASTVTTEIVQEVNQAVSGVQDIVSLPSVDDSAFLQEIQQARNKKDETVERLHEFDQTQSTQLAELQQSLSTMNQYIESISSQFEAGDMSIGSYQAGQLQSNADWASINLAVSAKAVPPGEVDGFISEQKRLSPVTLGYEFTSGGVCTREDMMAASAQEEDVGWFKKTASFVLDFIPVVGNVKAAIETKTGENLITGVEYEGWERAILAASVVGGGVVKVLGKGVKGVAKVKGNPLLPTEGKVGTFKELVKQGTAFDNITPHHMPSAAKMKQAGVKRNNGVSMNMEQPHPGVGGRHRETYTYGLSGNKLEDYLNLGYRDAFAHDILDARRIYMKDGVYTPEIREGLLNTIRKNRELYPELFNK